MKNEVINERAEEIIRKFKTVIFAMKTLKINMSKIKNIVKLEVIVIIHENIELLHIAYVT